MAGCQHTRAGEIRSAACLTAALGNLTLAGSSKFNSMAQELGPQLSRAGPGGILEVGMPEGFPRRCLQHWGRGEGKISCKDVPCAFTVNHHCSEQALLLAAQPVVRLALLVTEAGQALGTGQVLTDCVLHTGTQAVRASWSWARREERRVHVNQTGCRNSRGSSQVASLSRRGEGQLCSSNTPSPLHTISQLIPAPR